MKKLFASFKQEDGAVAIIMAVVIVVLLGFSAFAVDFGVYNLQKSKLQTACDAAALAAAHNLPDTTQATSTALAYITKNGFSAADVTVTFETIDNVVSKITVTSSRPEKAYFGNIFGINHYDMSAHATAMYGTSESGNGVFDYLIFQGALTGTLTMGGTFDVYGSVHSNGNFSASPGHGYIMGAAEARLTSWINIWTCTAGAVVSNAANIPMVDFTDCVNQVKPSTWTTIAPSVLNNPTSRITKTGNFWVTAGNVSIRNGFTLTGNLWVNGNLTISGGSPVCIQNGGLIYATGSINFGNTYQGDGCVFAGGSITFTGGNNTVTPNKPLCLYSANGNISLTAGSAHVYGIVYAPNGSVNLAGNNTTFHGNLIGNTVTGIPAKLTMYSNDVVQLPFTIGARTASLTG